MDIPVKTTSTTAVVSLICGLLGWSFAPVVGSILAVVLGHMARAQIRASGGALEGDGLALAGLILGWIAIVTAILGIVVLFLFFGGLAALSFFAN